MTKLTTERLEYYAALPTQPAEGDGFFKKGIFMHEVRRMARQLLAYEQAAPAQPVIPRKWTIFNAVSFIAEYKPTSYEEAALLAWNTCRAEMLKAQQNEPQNIPENIPAVAQESE